MYTRQYSLYAQSRLNIAVFGLKQRDWVGYLLL